MSLQATLKRSDELLPRGRCVERRCGHIPDIEPYDCLPCRHIGSLLRPSELIPARREAPAGRISRAGFKVIEDRAVEDAIRLQVTGGLSEGSYPSCRSRST